MGLFDKLRDVADVALANASKKFIESQQEKPHNPMPETPEAPVQDPFQDPEIKQYFEIACGMHGTLRSGTNLTASDIFGYPWFKLYAEHFLDGSYDEEKLKRALELYHASWGNYITPKDQKYYQFARELRDATVTRDYTGYTGPYAMDRYTVCRIFYQEEIAAAAVKYQNVLDVIENNINYKHFAQGMANIDCDDAIKQIVVADSLCAGNPITQKVVFEYIDNSLKERSAEHNKRLQEGDYDEIRRKFPQVVAQLALRAAHFHMYGHNKENYIPLTDEELREFVLNEEYYKKRIEDNPFNKDSWIQTYTSRIKDPLWGSIFSHVGNYGHRFELNYVDEYSCDVACNVVWKEIAGQDPDSKDLCESTDPITILHIVLKYLHTTME